MSMWWSMVVIPGILENGGFGILARCGIAVSPRYRDRFLQGVLQIIVTHASRNSILQNRRIYGDGTLGSPGKKPRWENHGSKINQFMLNLWLICPKFPCKLATNLYKTTSTFSNLCWLHFLKLTSYFCTKRKLPTPKKIQETIHSAPRSVSHPENLVQCLVQVEAEGCTTLIQCPELTIWSISWKQRGWSFGDTCWKYSWVAYEEMYNK